MSEITAISSEIDWSNVVINFNNKYDILCTCLFQVTHSTQQTLITLVHTSTIEKCRYGWSLYIMMTFISKTHYWSHGRI